MKYNIKTDTLLFLMLYTKPQHEKILKKHYLTQKDEKQSIPEVLYRNIYRILKLNFL